MLMALGLNLLLSVHLRSYSTCALASKQVAFSRPMNERTTYQLVKQRLAYLSFCDTSWQLSDRHGSAVSCT